MPHHEENNFSAPAEVQEFEALLFDMDGTIIDSTEAIVKHWHQIGKEIGVPGEEILLTSHGRRSIDVLALLAPDRANWDYVCLAEGNIPKLYGSSIVEIPGSRTILSQLDAVGAPWAIVTSGTRPLVQGWLDVMKLAQPKNMVTAEEVVHGKPDPECYRMGAKRLNFEGEGSKVVVFEDAPAGVRAGKAAGFRVVGLATTHAVEALREAGADWIVRDMRSVVFKGWDGKRGVVEVEIREGLVV
ncbi:hypothetical protein M409DRAFT_27901 [Zasmidium cellare ATCC 36951]|uniref:Glycerol-3-phosphate phosphatase n=1 Tax=Zasmidium cellare ATCC 36951 TaxID=1080233 RepID=A0A6A6C4A2_ZASCE|nr:uncharacterized protein M409DRAFT_27901 [Zasmidium cellare ATCC 36951]KAF2161845.1 hypothetical protein M409DRAFT_27901 [Zasmidium cellare ATCC 36951]